MPFVERDGLRYYQFQSFLEAGVPHGLFTRAGGVSPAPWSSLNLGGTVGDERSHVIENRKRIFSVLGRSVESGYDVWQVHSCTVLHGDTPRPLDQPHQKADSILTGRPEVTLFMRFADCVPVLFFDPVRWVVGMAHAGWKGTVEHIAAETVAAMAQRYGSDPADVLAGIGPSIGPDHYEVRQDVASQVRAAFDGRADQLLRVQGGRTTLDLWTANEMTLRQAGVIHIEQSHICTACDLDNWFSHRGEAGRTGRYGALIALPDGRPVDGG